MFNCSWNVYETLTMKNNIAPSKGYYSGPLKRSLGDHEISRSGPWGTSVVSKGAHSGVRSLPLRGRPQRGDMVKCGHLRTDGGGIKEFANDRKPALFIIIVVCFADALYL